MRNLLRKILMLLPAVFAELLVLILVSRFLSPYAALVDAALTLIAFFFVVSIINDRDESAYKTLWTLTIALVPILGLVLYWLFSRKSSLNPLGKQLQRVQKNFPDLRLSTPEYSRFASLEKRNLRLAETFHYLENTTGFPVVPIESANYYSLGEDMYAAMLKDLENAEKFIFVEFFILARGTMLDSMLEIMERKAKAGVDVRVLYDDFGSLSTFSAENAAELRKKGIKCVVFNPVLFVGGSVNNRDHRKILVIDGKIAYSGGVNLADEYINKKMRFQHWKDIGFRLTGEPVKSYTKMFAEFWNAFTGRPIHLPDLFPDIISTSSSPASKPAPKHAQNFHSEVTFSHTGYVLSYYDSPFTDFNPSHHLLKELLSQSTHYAWFYTPYLLPSDSLLDSFCRAAERGVDVRIVLPAVPDKKIVFRMSRSFYPRLLRAGVKIYEYTPGFIHAKACLVDDDIATVGSVNLDYRSLFLHFENNSLFYKAHFLSDLKADFLDTFTKSRARTLKDISPKHFSHLHHLIDSLLRLFAPLC